MREVVFVFGSNLAGRHGKGAALEAARHWGAEYGVGEGRTGNAYALPTKDESLRTLSEGRIRGAFGRFYGYAAQHPNTQFLLTPAGSGLAGLTLETVRDLADIKRGRVPRNIWLTGDWFA